MVKKTEDSKFFSNPVKIGRVIENELRRQERTVTWLSRKIHCDRRNIYDIFKRDTIDTQLLYRLSVALHVDFFELFSRVLVELSVDEGVTPPLSVNNQSQMCEKILTHVHVIA